MKNFFPKGFPQYRIAFVVLAVLVIGFSMFPTAHAQTSGSSTAEACLTACGSVYQGCVQKTDSLSSSAKTTALNVCATTYKGCELTCYPSNPTDAKSWDSAISEVMTASTIQEAILVAQRYGLSVNYEHGDGTETAEVTNPITGETLDTMVQYTDDFTADTTPPVPTVTLTAGPTSFTLGNSTTLTWSSTNATSCTASGNWTGTLPISGTNTQKPSAVGNYSYTITCTGAGGSANASASVTVVAPARTTSPSGAGSGGTKSTGRIQQSFNNSLNFFSSLFASLIGPVNPFQLTAQVVNGTPGGSGTTNVGGIVQCSVSGSNGKASIIKYGDGTPFALTRNYSVSTTCYAGVDNTFCSLSKQASASAITWANGLGGVQSVSSSTSSVDTLKISIAHFIDDHTLAALAFVQSTNGGKTAYITFSELKLQAIMNHCNLSSGQALSYIRYLTEHEMLHTFGIGDENFEGSLDLMNGVGLSCQEIPNKVNNTQINPSELQALRNIAKGIDVSTDNNCEMKCGPGYVLDANLSGGTTGAPQELDQICKKPGTLCGPNGTKGTSGYFDEASQACKACEGNTVSDNGVCKPCPNGTTAKDDKCVSTSPGSCPSGEVINSDTGFCQSIDTLTITCSDPNYEYDWFSNECVLPEGTASDSGSLNPGVSTSIGAGCVNNSGTCLCFDDYGNQIDPIPEKCSMIMSGLPPATGSTEPGLDGAAANLGGGVGGGGSAEDSFNAYCESAGQEDPSCWFYYYPEDDYGAAD